MVTIAVPPSPPPDEEDPLIVKRSIKENLKTKDILSAKKKSSSDTTKSDAE